MLGFDALLGARYGSYPEMLDVLRELGRAPQDIGRRLFERIVFNIAIGNNDDYARNHAAFWNGERVELTPAFDLAPQPRSTDTSAQAMAIGRDGSRASSWPRRTSGCTRRSGGAKPPSDASCPWAPQHPGSPGDDAM